MHNSLLQRKTGFWVKCVFVIMIAMACMAYKMSFAQDSAVKQPIRILASIEPLAMLTQSLIPPSQQKYWEIQTLVPRSSSTHEYQIKPSDILKMKNSDTFLWWGHEAEPVFAQAASRFASRSAELSQAKLHWLHFGPGEEDDGHHHQAGAVDPHIWLSLPQVPAMLEFIANTLDQSLEEYAAQNSQISPDELKHMKYQIQQQLRIQLDAHQQLMLRIKGLSEHWSNKQYISFHNAFAYLDEGINVHSLGSFVQNPEDGVAPRQLQKLKKAMDSNQLGCAFLEPSSKGRRIETLLPEGFKTVELDILAALMSDGTTWTEYWNEMVNQMDVCFSSPAI